MRWSTLRRQFGFTAALLALLVAGCGGTGGSAPPGASTTLIVARDISVVVSLDPQQSYEQLTYDRAVYDTLVAFDRADTSKVVKSVADSWSTSSDGMTWTFHLRRGIRFASGNELTAADYVYSFQRIVNLPKNPAAWLVTQMGITAGTVARQVVASDPYTLKITVTQPIAPGAFLDIMTFPTTAAIDSRVVKQHDVGGDLGHAWLDDHSAGSGPFILDRWDRASQIALKGNPRYNLGPKPSLTRIVFKNVTESSSQFDLLQKGGADVALGLTHQQLSQLQGNSKYRVQRQPDLSLEYLGMNVKTVPAFGNPLVRQAIKYAIDYKGLAGQLMNGEAILNQSIVPKGVAGYDSSLPYSQNIEKAKGLLQQAGYPDGFTFELLVQTSDINGVPSSDVVSKIKSDLARIGVTANPRQVQSSQLYTIMRPNRSRA